MAEASPFPLVPPADSEPARDVAAKVDNVSDTAAKKARKAGVQKDKDEENTRALVLPTARIRRIIKSEPDFCILGGDAVALISKSTEMFLRDFVTVAHDAAVADRRKTVKYNDLSAQVRDRERLEFLLDIIPEKTTKRKHLRNKDASTKRAKTE